MTRSEKVFGFILVLVVGVWGCAKGPESAATGKSASLEAKAQRLEEDFRSAAAARDQFKQKLLATEEKLAAAETRATQIASERDSLKNDLQAMATQYESFRKNLKALIGQAESALGQPTRVPPITVGVNTQSGEPETGVRN